MWVNREPMRQLRSNENAAESRADSVEDRLDQQEARFDQLDEYFAAHVATARDVGDEEEPLPESPTEGDTTEGEDTEEPRVPSAAPIRDNL